MDNKKVAKSFLQIFKNLVKKIYSHNLKNRNYKIPTRCSSAKNAQKIRKNFYENSENGHF